MNASSRSEPTLAPELLCQRSIDGVPRDAKSSRGLADVSACRGMSREDAGLLHGVERAVSVDRGVSRRHLDRGFTDDAIRRREGEPREDIAKLANISRPWVPCKAGNRR